MFVSETLFPALGKGTSMGSILIKSRECPWREEMVKRVPEASQLASGNGKILESLRADCLRQQDQMGLETTERGHPSVRYPSAIIPGPMDQIGVSLGYRSSDLSL